MGVRLHRQKLGAAEMMNDEVQASEQERAQILLERAQTQMEVLRMAQAERLERKARKPRPRRA